MTFATRDGGDGKYGRLVWEPYQQDEATTEYGQAGTYTDLQKGLWWTNKIENPNPDSQSAPQPLAFFGDTGGAGWTNVIVYAIDVHQGTTTDATSILTKLSYNGTDIPLGNADTTPFAQTDLTAAVANATAPLNAQIDTLEDAAADDAATIADLQSQITALKAAAATKDATISTLEGQADTKDATITTLEGQVKAKDATISSLQSQVKAKDATISALQSQIKTKDANVSTLQGQAKTKDATIKTLQSQAKTKGATISTLQGQVKSLTSYKSTHHTVDGTDLGTSRALLSATPVAGKTVKVTLSGAIAKATSVKYQWYVGGTAVKGAAKSSYTVPKAAKGKSVSVSVSGVSRYIRYAVHSNTLSAK